MKLIIAGSRTLLFDGDKIVKILALFDLYAVHIDEVVSGCAKGIDSAGEHYAGWFANTKLKRFPADWDEHGKAAGHIRNSEMAHYADALLLIWDGKSTGSKNMKETMKKLGKPVYEVVLRKHNV